MVGPCTHRPAHTHLIGPSLPITQRGDEVPFDWSRLDASLPLVYLSFGSRVYWQPELIQKIATAAAKLGVQLLVSAGDLATSDFVRQLPGNVVAAAYLPQLAVLERASVFITHAGTNSVSEAMYYGVPLLALPICNEEPVQAYYAEQAKVGLQLEPFSCTAGQIEDALRQLLDPKADCRRGIAEVMRSYRDSNGARRAAELIVSVPS